MHQSGLSHHVNQKICSFPPAEAVISISTLDVFPGHPTDIGVIEAEPFSIRGAPDVGAVVTEVGQPHVGDHSEELVPSPRLPLSSTGLFLRLKERVQIQALGKYSEWQTFSVRRFLMENRMRCRVKVWGRRLSFRTCFQQVFLPQFSQKHLSLPDNSWAGRSSAGHPPGFSGALSPCQTAKGEGQHAAVPDMLRGTFKADEGLLHADGIEGLQPRHQVHIRDLVLDQVPDGEVELGSIVLDKHWYIVLLETVSKFHGLHRLLPAVLHLLQQQEQLEGDILLCSSAPLGTVILFSILVNPTFIIST